MPNQSFGLHYHLYAQKRDGEHFNYVGFAPTLGESIEKGLKLLREKGWYCLKAVYNDQTAWIEYGKNHTGKVEGLTNKDFSYLEMCKVGAKEFSSCVKRQFYSIIVSVDGRVIGTGYNGTPSGYLNCNKGGCPRSFLNCPDGSSYDNCTSLHSEENALLYSDRSLRMGGTLYVNGLPCWHCAKLIVGSGLKRTVAIDSTSWVDRDKVIKFFEDNRVELALAHEDL